MKRNFSLIAYLLIMAMFVLPMSGCDLDDDDDNAATTAREARTAAANKVLVVSSDAFEEGEEYNIFTGDPKLVGAVENVRYYVGQKKSETPVVLQLEFNDAVSNDTGFVITKKDSYEAVFAYDPNGTVDYTNTASVGTASTGKKSYSGLELSDELTTSSITASTIEIDSSDEIVITLSGTSAILSGATSGTLSAQGYVWHVSPDHDGEYWTYGGTEYDEDDVLSSVTSTDGVYIARDVRYVPDYLEFSSSQTATKAYGTSEGDSDTLYVAYYDESVAGSANKYILAALPSTMGAAMGGGTPGGGGRPDGGMDGGRGGPGGAMPPAAVTDFNSIVEAMTHSESEAYSNPVLHITRPGTYRLKGTWHGQIWVDIPDKSVNSSIKTKKDPEAKVALILDGIEVSCDVAPALVFKKVYEATNDIGLDSETAVSTSDAWKTLASKLYDDEGDIFAGALVVIASGSTNTFSGTNVARLNELTINGDDGYSATHVGTYVKAQEKMYKLDAAFHSRMTMMIGLEDGASSGTLNIISNYEGLDSEMHMLIDSGTVNVTADDDGVNVNEDNVSIFDMEDGSLTISSSGGDGIDSNGYVVINGGSLTITAGSSRQGSAGESGIDADKSVYIYNESAYTWKAANADGGSGSEPPTESEETVETHSDTITRSDGTEAGVVTFKTATVQSPDHTPEERIANGVAESGPVFKIFGTVNNFSGIK